MLVLKLLVEPATNAILHLPVNILGICKLCHSTSSSLFHTPANGGSHADPMDRAPARSAEKSSGASASGGLSLEITKCKKIDAKVQTDGPDVGCNGEHVDCKKLLLSSTSSMCRDLSDSLKRQNGLLGTVISKILTCCSEKILML